MFNYHTHEYETNADIVFFLNDLKFEKKHPCSLNKTENFLYIDELWGFSSVDTTTKYANEHKVINHGKSEIIVNGYLDFFVHVLHKYCENFDKIEFIEIGYIDRGIPSFRTFGNMLKDLFPNLKRLCIQQNWTFHNLKTDEDIANDYLYMLQILQLEKFMIISEQDVFFNYFSLEEISNVMKANSIYICINKQSTEEMFDDVENNKKIIVYKKYEIDHCL